LAVDSLEVAHQQAAEVDAGRDTRSPHLARIERLTEVLDEAVELVLLQHAVERLVERMPTSVAQAFLGDEQLLLLVAALSHCHSEEIVRAARCGIDRSSPQSRVWFLMPSSSSAWLPPAWLPQSRSAMRTHFHHGLLALPASGRGTEQGERANDVP